MKKLTKEELLILYNEALKGHKAWCLISEIRMIRNDFATEYEECKDFYDSVSLCAIDVLILQVSKLFAENNNSYSFNDLKKMCFKNENENQEFTKYIAEICKECRADIKRLKAYRNKTIAHIDKIDYEVVDAKFAFNSEASLALFELIELVCRIYESEFNEELHNDSTYTFPMYARLKDMKI